MEDEVGTSTVNGDIVPVFNADADFFRLVLVMIRDVIFTLLSIGRVEVVSVFLKFN